MRYIEDGIYKCGVIGCSNKGVHAQSLSNGKTVLLCTDCFCNAWKMTDIGKANIKKAMGVITNE